MHELHLLVVDDDQVVRDLLREVAEGCHYHVECAATGQEFKLIYAKFNPDVLVIDLHLEDVDGIELLRFLADQQCKSLIILISGFDERILHTALRLGEDHGLHMLGTLHKPVRLANIRELLDQAQRELTLLTPEQLSKAIHKHQLVLHYQPKVQLKTKKIVGAEALVRWQPPHSTLIGPDDFVPLAEKNDLIKSITEWVVQQAFQQSSTWSKNNILLNISLNLSAKRLVN